jgi:hypothetical protein
MMHVLTVRVIKASANRVIEFIVSRPELDAFLRRQIFRFPGIAGRIRAIVSRSRRTHQPAPSAVTSEADLTDAARQVLRDLTHALDHRRQS